jgi:peptidoglycan/xylan/chitin deacetylase (PgdA/CDA1 family)
MKKKSLIFKAMAITFLSLGVTQAHQSHQHYFHEAHEVKTEDLMIKDLSSGNIEGIFRGNKTIILTIDDGPNPRVTPKVLDVLKKHNVKATFFVIGQQVARNKNIMKRTQAEGHIIGNHSFEHKYVGRMGYWGFKKKVIKEFMRAHDAVVPYMGPNQGYYYRAPGASWNKKAAKYINKTEVGSKYVGPLLWDIGGSNIERDGRIITAADWACWNDKWSIEKCLEGYINRTEQVKGGVVLFHDIHPNSAELLDRYLTRVKELGYDFMTLDDLNLDAK